MLHLNQTVFKTFPFLAHVTGTVLYNLLSFHPSSLPHAVKNFFSLHGHDTQQIATGHCPSGVSANFSYGCENHTRV
jgi:hypothetical protein